MIAMRTPVALFIRSNEGQGLFSPTGRDHWLGPKTILRKTLERIMVYKVGVMSSAS